MEKFREIIEKVDQICRKNNIPFNGLEKATLIAWLDRHKADKIWQLFEILRTEEEDERWTPKSKRFGYRR